MAEQDGGAELWPEWLGRAGLSRYVRRFETLGITDDIFKALQESDYGRLGIDATQAADRQKMTKLVRSLSGGPRPPASPPPRRPTPEEGAGAQQGLADEEEELCADDGLPRIRVLVRKRPLNARERGRREEDVVHVSDGCRLVVHETRTKVDGTRYVEPHAFTFDGVLDEACSGEEVYATAVAPLVDACLRRCNTTCFAYGQTGSGKTHTMRPLPARAAGQLLEALKAGGRLSGVRLFLSYFEIYGGRVFDLLAERRKLCIRESGSGEVCVVGLREHAIAGVPGVQALIERGDSARTTGSTAANADSSRSHAILQLALRWPATESEERGRLYGKFSFIDLAGSERGADTTDKERQTRLEGAEINKSLLALKECIRALDQDRGRDGGSIGRHIPFRGSKLTEILRDSFSARGRTVMVANVSPSSGSCEHTLNTLRYADRVKELRRERGAATPAGGDERRRPLSASPLVRRPAFVAAQRAAPPAVPTAPAPPQPPPPPPPPPPPSEAEADSLKAEEEALLASAHDELMATILEEEEEIEDTMESVRGEMALLHDVDLPGSTIDAYVTGLATILEARAASMAELQERLTTFQRHLKEEEILRTARAAGWRHDG